jgi:hypothetical protein
MVMPFLFSSSRAVRGLWLYKFNDFKPEAFKGIVLDWWPHEANFTNAQVTQNLRTHADLRVTH